MFRDLQPVECDAHHRLSRAQHFVRAVSTLFEGKYFGLTIDPQGWVSDFGLRV